MIIFDMKLILGPYPCIILSIFSQMSSLHFIWEDLSHFVVFIAFEIFE